MRNFVSTLSKSEPSLLEELWDYFAENYLYTNRSYENLGLSESSVISLSNILLGIFIGIVLASVAMVYDKRVTGGLVRKLLLMGGVGKDNALTLEALGYSKNTSIFRALRKSVALRKVVKCAEEVDFNNELERRRAEYEKRRESDPTVPEFKAVEYEMSKSDKFYIPFEQKSVAEKKFSAKNSSWWIIPIMVVLSAVGFVALLFILPNVLELTNAVVGSF